MICYRLHCTNGHEFEGWFPNGVAFDRQKAEGLVTCPQCGVNAVEKSLMAPALARRDSAPSRHEVSGQEASASAAGAPSPDLAITPADQLRMVLRAIRREVQARCDNVGDRFAEEALKRHDRRDQGDRHAERGIYGTMSDSDRERLEDEGVDFSPIPWIDYSES